MEEFNWREEQSVNITSDLSSFEDEKTEAGDGDASATTLTQELSPNNSVLGGVNTPTQSNLPNSVPSSGRLSLSQPQLPVSSKSPARTSRLNMSTGNICNSSGKPPRPNRVPLSQTLEENKNLKEEIAVLKSKLNVEQYKVAELTSLQPREVQDILDEYYSLQMSKFDLEGERRQMADERKQFKLELDNIEVQAKTKIDMLERQLHESERNSRIVIEQYKEQIKALEAEIAKWEELPTSIDGLKGDDSDWTIRSEGDIVSEELRKRVSALQKENKALREKIDDQKREFEEKTFTVGGGCDVETLLQRIDHLEACLRDEEEERNKTSSALVAYMSRCHSLEKKIRNANLSYTDMSLSAKNKEEVLRLVEKIRDVLRALGKQNKELRKECTLLLGLDDQSGLSPSSSAAFETPERKNVSGVIAEKSRLLAEDFEKKQQEILDSLKALADNVTNFDESVLNILRDIGTSGDNEEQQKGDGAALAELPNPDQADVSQPRPDPNNATANMSAMNASIIELMNRSMNTSKDIAGFKVKLVSFRDVMQRMFENLRSSGVLFEDILELLGSGTDEMRSLAEKIRVMKFEWDSAIEEKRVVMDAIEDTVVSINNLQVDLSNWEHSLNETSFRLDVSMAHSTTHCFSAQTARADEEGDLLLSEQGLAELRTQISLKTEEIMELRAAIEEANEARDLALSSADNLRADLKQMETRLISMAGERDRLISTVQSDDAEKRILRESLESQLATNEQVQRDVLQLRSQSDAFIREMGEKDALIVELEAKLAAAKNSNTSLKEVISERESKLDALRAALEEEQERRQREHESWKTDLTTAQDTSSALRRDFERIRNELSIKDEKIRNLQDQLRTVEETNIRMAEAVSDIASHDNHAVRSAKAYPNSAVAEVQTMPPLAKLKSRDAQTDITRTSLAQMECDAVSYSSELNAIRSAYSELSEAIGQLVVKKIEPLPQTSDSACIEKSCKELSRLIHHERRRRENQANELAAMTAKIEELRQKGALDVGEIGSKNVSMTSVDAAPHAQKFDDPMRQTLFVLTAMAMDLVKQLRRLALLQAAGKQVDFTPSIDLARKLRNELNDRFLIVRSEKENENKYCVADLVHTVRILERDNRTLYENVKTWQKEYEALEKQHAENPEIAERIASQLRNIHSVMGEFKRTCGQLKEPSNGANTRRDAPTQ